MGLIFAYYLLSPMHRQDNPKISCFRDWVIDKAARAEGDDATSQWRGGLGRTFKTMECGHRNIVSSPYRNPDATLEE